jgi:hypothetical protein
MRVPSVSVLVTVGDDRDYLRDCLDSLQDQDYPAIVEVLVTGPNPKEIRGDVVVRAPARARYAADAVRRCVESIPDATAGSASETLRAVGTTAFGRAVAAVAPSREASLRGWRRRASPEVSGGSAAVPASVTPVRPSRGSGSWYFTADTPAAHARRSLEDGGPRQEPAASSPAPAAAALVAVSVAMALTTRRWRRIAVPIGHALACGVVALRAGRDPGVAPHRAFLAIEISHWFMGAGWWLRSLRRQGVLR